ncbi:hypothetical protein E2C01_031409 [Portunus trituberculatus]|uniref:Uncharacterized protein n=1 Tax=Portunus trituberculatus TaxID=210409 RepID=A0A5B7F005_PORTR|nr:hypothetical protein [Portunus trituberculatus]
MLAFVLQLRLAFCSRQKSTRLLLLVPPLRSFVVVPGGLVTLVTGTRAVTTRTTTTRKQGGCEYSKTLCPLITISEGHRDDKPDLQELVVLSETSLSCFEQPRVDRGCLFPVPLASPRLASPCLPVPCLPVLSFSVDRRHPQLAHSHRPAPPQTQMDL